MARMIKNVRSMTLGVALTTVFEDESKTVRNFKIGDTVENLRYVQDGEIVIISGRITDLSYTMASRLAWNARKPADTLSTDMTLVNITIDASSEYHSNVVTIPLTEVVEFEEETKVARMEFKPYITYDMELHYSDYRVEKVSVQNDDIFDNVRIINPANVGIDYTGKYQVIGFAYTVSGGVINVSGIAFRNVDTDEVLVTDFDYILALNEVYVYQADSAEAITEILGSLAEGDTVEISNVIDTSAGAININKKNITITMNDAIISNGSANSGIRVANGSLVIQGDAQIVNNTPYDKNHSSGVIGVSGGGELIFNGSGVSAVINDDPANKGQFGVVLHQDAHVIVNDGTFETGWYCISGNGSTTNADSVVEINGGEFVSVADYAIYHPQPGKLIINGGKFSGAAGAIAANNGIIEINGGEFAVLGGGATGEWGDGTSGLQDVALNLNAKYGDVTCRITGGIFHATAAGTIMIQTGTTHTVDLKISGGKFSSKPNDEWIAEGYTCSSNTDEDGFYTVIKTDE